MPTKIQLNIRNTVLFPLENPEHELDLKIHNLIN